MLADASEAFGQADPPLVARPDYQNLIFVPAPDKAAFPNATVRQAESVAFFSGHVGAAGSSSTPNAGGVYLTQSAIGQPVGGVPERIPGETFKFGAPIVAQASLGVNDRREPFRINRVSGDARFISGANRVFGTSPGYIEIEWYRSDGATNSPVIYYIEPEPVRDPMVLFHTHASEGFITNDTGRIEGVPIVSVGGLQVTIHTNTVFPSTNVIDLFPSAGQRTNIFVKAPNSGLILFEYRDSSGQFLDVEIVKVLPNIPDGPSLTHLGSQFRPSVEKTPWAAPVVFRGINLQNDNENFVYRHELPESSQAGSLWAIRKTSSGQDVQVYWRRVGSQGVVWPYEFRAYIADWPLNNPEKYQLYARSHTAPHGPSVVIPDGLNAELMKFQVPPGHASWEKPAFRTTDAGWSLLKYRMGNDVSFQVVRSVLRTDPLVWRDPKTVPWDIGKEITEITQPTGVPGYIHAPEGNRYDWETYEGLADPPNWEAGWTTKQIFPVNIGTLEVWWHNTNQTVVWPSLVRRYDCGWPQKRESIVIASQTGSGPIDPDKHKNFRVYFQNDPAKAGFNPNDEHAFPLEAGNGQAVFALRSDLGTPATSEPYVLLKYRNPQENDLWRFRVFEVLAENETYRFNYSSLEPVENSGLGNRRAMGLRAGQLIQPPFPVGYLNFLEYCTENAGVSGPFWADRRTNYWARAAGDWGTRAIPADFEKVRAPTNIVMRFFYSTNTGLVKGLYFPPQKPPKAGRDVPSHVAWLDYLPKPGFPNGEPGVPANIAYLTVWPDDVPTLRFGETLVKRKFGLPDIAGMKSAEIVYQQSVTNGTGESVKLIDPTREFSVPLTHPPGDIQLAAWDGKTWFPTLPPHLRSRLWYDDVQHLLKFKGDTIEPVAGELYLLLNVITERERNILTSLSGDVDFRKAVTDLANLRSSVLEVPPNTVFDTLALTAGLARGGGYVTIVENNSTNLALNDPADPIRPHIIYVECPLYQGELKVIASDNPFDEQITLRHSADLAGKAENYIFQWRTLPPRNGLPPTPPYEDWGEYRAQPSSGRGAIDITIAGPGLYTLTDNYFVCRYGTTNLVGGCADNVIGGTNWSEWTRPILAEGWIKRVLAGINPYDQRIKDYRRTEVNTIVSMISQAGPPSQGAVALNAEQVNGYGLIEIYETVVKRGIGFSIDAGFSYGPANDALLLATTRLADLHTLLANEAYADASDPTIAYGTETGQYGIEASSIHCFQNQTGSLLDEELGLLRGRDDALLPSVHTPPFYNRLIWNFTQADGEVAYVNNYGMRDRVWQDPNTGSVDPARLDGVITEADAKLEYPQGHGDAWGHYLTALKGYYRLLRHPFFAWIPRIESVQVGGVAVAVDYEDERKFAKAAALRAQTGAEIVNLTYRSRYVESPSEQYFGYPDARTNRNWGVGDWAVRAGQGAFFDWVVGNSLVPETYQESHRLTDQSVAPLEAQANYRVTLTVLTNVAIAVPDLSASVFQGLQALNGRDFFGRAEFIDQVDQAIGSSNRMRIQNVLFSGARTGGLPELVFAGLDLLKGKQFPTMAAVEEAFRAVAGDSAAQAYFASEIRSRVVLPGASAVEGIQKIDRGTVTELRDIASACITIQEQMDKADLGLNPLGLVKNVIPFDIDPDQIENPTIKKTHFEQIYDRAVGQMNNAIAVFNHAVNASQNLRRQADSLADFVRSVEDREADFNNRLIEIFGYPYADDIGPNGTYRTDNEPDLFHYMYSDMSRLTGILPENISILEFTVTNRDLTISENVGVIQSEPRLVKFHVDRNSFGFVKPPSWRGQRRAPGEIQRAHSQLLLAKSRFDRSLIEYDNLLAQIEDETRLLRAQYNLDAQEISVLNSAKNTQESLNDRIKASRVRQLVFRGVAEKAGFVGRALSEGVPKTIGFIAGLASGFVADPSFAGRFAAINIAGVISEIARVAGDVESIAELDHQQAKEEAQLQSSIVLAALRQEAGIAQKLAQIQHLVRQERLLSLSLFTEQEGLQQAEGDYASALARGQRVLADRLRFRQQTAGKIQEYRYKDMAFRIFRNDAIQKYRAQFDMAALYVYLAAKAYDYETNLKPNDPARPGEFFLNQIARARTIGVIGANGPQTGAKGDSGLADPMARMAGAFSPPPPASGGLKSQLGIINPISEFREFSLKSELLRVVPGGNSTAAWREALARSRVRDLNQISEFKRTCLFQNTNAEPGLVMRFPTTINRGLNHFHWPYGAGDNRFNDTAFATKIKSIGISFINYRTAGPGGMAKSPYAYLVPIGTDILRSPRLPGDDDINYLREWKVFDQVLPVAHRLNDKNDPALALKEWLPLTFLAPGWSWNDERRHGKFAVWHEGLLPQQPAETNFRSRRLVSRSVWNTEWLLVIPAADLGGSTPAEYDEYLERFINGGLVNGVRDGNGVSDIRLRIDAGSFSGR